MFKVGNPLACGLLMAFLFRIVILNAPGVNALGTRNSNLLLSEISAGIDYSTKQYSPQPGPDLNIPMVKDQEENLKEQLFKAIKYPAPLIIFSLYLSFIFFVGSFLIWSFQSLRRRTSSRLYLSVSILRI